MRFQIRRARELYRSADRGIELLPPRSAACVRSARVLYSRILDEIEANDYDVFSTRAGPDRPQARDGGLVPGRFDREEEAVGCGAGAMVHGVTRRDPPQPPARQHRAPVRHPPVHGHVVHQDVQRPVDRHAGPGAKQPVATASARVGHRHDRQTGEQQRESVVVLPPGVQGQVVAAVPAPPAWAVHHETVGQGGRWLTQHRRDRRHRRRSHGALQALVADRARTDWSRALLYRWTMTQGALAATA